MPPQLSLTLIILAIFAVALLVGVLWIRSRSPATLPYYSKETLLSKGELVFYRSLRRAVPPGLIVCFKVRLSDLIGCSAQGWREGFGAKISQKHVDFVLVNAETSAIALAIELDDKTHLAPDRRARDLFVDRALGAAGIAILRVQAAARYDVRGLTQAVAERVRAAA